MSAPTSVMATRLMRLQRPSFLSVNLPLAIPKLTPVLAQPQPSSRHPLARKPQDTEPEEPEPVAGRAAARRNSRPRRVVPERDRPRQELLRVFLHRHGSAPSTRQSVAVRPRRKPDGSPSASVESQGIGSWRSDAAPGHPNRLRRPRRRPLERDRSPVLYDGPERAGRCLEPSRRLPAASSPWRRPRCGSSVRCVPPRKAHRQSPSTATVTRRARPASPPKTAGRGAPRRPSCALNATQSPDWGCSGVIWMAGGNESTGSPRNAPTMGDASLGREIPVTRERRGVGACAASARRRGRCVPSAIAPSRPIWIRRSARLAACRTVSAGTRREIGHRAPALRVQPDEPAHRELGHLAQGPIEKPAVPVRRAPPAERRPGVGRR